MKKVILGIVAIVVVIVAVRYIGFSKKMIQNKMKKAISR